MNDLVIYENQFNNIALKKFTANQLNLLLAICSHMREKGQDNIIFDLMYLKKLIKLDKNYTTVEFMHEILSVNKKLLELNFTFETTKEIIQFALFSVFKLNKDDLSLKVQVNSEFAFLLNNLTSNFTRFELEEFVNFKSSYTKEFYRRMKQFRSTGVWKISLEEFKRLLDVPKSYKISHIDSFVLKPILTELKSYKLTCEKIYKSGIKAGRPKVEALEFKFSTKKFVSDEEFEERINKAVELAVKEEENKAKVEVLTLDKLNELYKNNYIMIFDKFANINVKAYITSITRENDKVLINIYTETAKNISIKKESLAHANNYIKNKLNKYSVKKNES